MTTQFYFHNIEIWGTVITIQTPIQETVESNFGNACDESRKFFERIDQRFSTYREDSEVTRLRQGIISAKECSLEMQHVINECCLLKELTFGAFDPWAVKGGFDPSGFVKGWAAQSALSIFIQAGIKSVQVNAGGDVALCGGYDSETPWRIGIRHPDLPNEIARTIELFDGAIGSSGTYERGAHIIDPEFGVPAVGARAATVVGPDGGWVDALATALIVDGRDAVNWIGSEAFSAYSFWGVDKDGDGSWSYSKPETTLRRLS